MAKRKAATRNRLPVLGSANTIVDLIEDDITSAWLNICSSPSRRFLAAPSGSDFGLPKQRKYPNASWPAIA
jgi:hypothetical protein